jgi:hypothetical protein
MQTALSDASLRGEELRYVTEHFGDLKGLRVAPFWAGVLLVTVVIPLFSLSRLRALEALILFFVVLAAIWIPWSGAWYRRHYGTVVNPERSRAPFLGAAMIVFLIIYSGSALFSTLDRYRGDLSL